jgi:glucose/mannose-6-phosphate isomerase
MPDVLDRATVATFDSTSQFAEVLDLPVHLRDALWRVDSAGLAPMDAPGGLVVAGMGGSGVGALLALGALGDRLKRPMVVVQGYSLPSWIGSDAVVLISSYSGGTEEALSCYDAARRRGARLVVTTTGGELARRARDDGYEVIPLPGGFQPRAAIGYATVVALEVAALCGVAPSLRAEVEAAAALAERLVADWGPEAAEDNLAKELARRLHDTVPVAVGAELTAPVAYRWKCQFNENAKLPAFHSELPEADHNEICGWDSAEGRLSAVLLTDSGLHPRNAARMDLTGRIIEDSGGARGEAPLERLVSLVLLGDLVSLYVAVLRGVDPVEIKMIDRLKDELADRCPPARGAVGSGG